MPSDEFALYTSNGLNGGFFLRGGEHTHVIAFVRTLTPDEAGERASKLLEQTLESPDRRIILPAKLHHLTAYEFETSGSPGELKFGCHIKGIDEDQFVPFCDVKDTYQLIGSDGPYNEGVFKSQEYEIAFGWPELADLDFVQVLQERGIWLIACNKKFRSAHEPYDQSKMVHVVLVFASESGWRVHPDYSYCRALESGFHLEWDPQQENYLATPLPRE